jgi:anti-anti-sigma factor
VLREHFDTDETLRLAVLGDLDIAAAETLSKRLAELKAADRPVRLDLSEVAFIDSSGIQALLRALADARWSGWRLEVAREVSPSVERAAQVVKIGQVLWPEDLDPPRTDATAPPRSAPSTTAAPARGQEPARGAPPHQD